MIGETRGGSRRGKKGKGMLYKNVCIEGLGYVLPEKVIESTWIEEQIAPVYAALGLPTGFLEQMSGVKERRWWDEGVAFSDASAMAGERAIADAGVDKNEIGIVVHTSVCRDWIEPSTACIVHHKLGLGPHALNFDVGSACLGFLEGMKVVANMIELRQIGAGIVTAGENSREIIMATIDRMLKTPPSLEFCSEVMAALTFGSGGVAMVLTDASRSLRKKRLLGSYSYASTEHHDLCVGQRTWGRIRPKEMLQAGLHPLGMAWEGFLKEMQWDVDIIDRIFTHQVSKSHRKQGQKVLGISLEKDFPTLAELGNIGSVSAPLCLAMGVEAGVVKDGDRICLMGMGSGINCNFMAIQW
jgi:acyl-CoA:acyl-CoA alkyltransferase